MPFNPAFRRAATPESVPSFRVVVSADSAVEQKAAKRESTDSLAQRFAPVVPSDKMMA